jgi:hypothetical protein
MKVLLFIIKPLHPQFNGRKPVSLVRDVSLHFPAMPAPALKGRQHKPGKIKTYPRPFIPPFRTLSLTDKAVNGKKN